MSQHLFESDFLTVNLRNIKTIEKSDISSQKVKNTSFEDQIKPTNFDWSKELKQRLAANKELSADARVSDYEIESKLFSEYFNNGWEADIAKKLIAIGVNLQKIIKILGFKKQNNPIVAFLSLKYVQNNLLKTDLLNSNTFKALYNAIASRLVADSEFFSANDYNIIYCRDLYKKSLKDIMEYLKLQSILLKTNVSEYTIQDQEKNKRVFLQLTKNKEKELTKKAKVQLELTYSKLPSVKDSRALLNTLELAEAIKDEFNSQSSKKTADSEAFSEITNKIKTPAQTMAFLQHLSLTTDSEAAHRALSSKKLSGISMEDLRGAIKQIAGFVSKIDFSETDANALAIALIDKL